MRFAITKFLAISLLMLPSFIWAGSPEGIQGNGWAFSSSASCPISDFCPVTGFGAICALPGTTDSSTAITNALTRTTGGAVYFPACPTNACYNLNSLVTYSLNSNGPMRVFGAGPNSKICVNNAAGGLQFIDTAGISGTHNFQLDHLMIVPIYAASAPAFGIDMKLIALANVNDIIIDGAGAPQPFNVGLQLDATQQSRFSGVRIRSANTGLLTQDASGVASNQNTFVNLYTSVNGTGVDLEGGAASNVFIGLSSQSNTASGVIVNQTGTAGYGPNAFYEAELENNVVNSYYAKAGNSIVEKSFLTGSPLATFALRVDSTGWITFVSNTVNAPIHIFGIGAGQLDWIEDNILNGTYTNDAGTDQVINLNNRGAGAAPNTVKGGFSSFATAPSCDASIKGMKWTFIGDVTTCTFNTPVTGLGGINCPATCDGTNWVGG